MASVTKTLSMGVGAGYLVTLGAACSFLELAARAECYVQPVTSAAALESAPVAPVASPAPALGAQADFHHLKAGEKVVYNLLEATECNRSTTYSHVRVWGIAADDLLVTGF